MVFRIVRGTISRRTIQRPVGRVFRHTCHFGVYHIDLKTAFLQGESYDNDRDIVCALPPEKGYPPHIGARMKKPAYGLNDAPHRLWNIIDKALSKYGMVPTPDYPLFRPSYSCRPFSCPPDSCRDRFVPRKTYSCPALFMSKPFRAQWDRFMSDPIHVHLFVSDPIHV